MDVLPFIIEWAECTLWKLEQCLKIWLDYVQLCIQIKTSSRKLKLKLLACAWAKDRWVVMRTYNEGYSERRGICNYNILVEIILPIVQIFFLLNKSQQNMLRRRLGRRGSNTIDWINSNWRKRNSLWLASRDTVVWIDFG